MLWTKGCFKGFIVFQLYPHQLQKEVSFLLSFTFGRAWSLLFPFPSSPWANFQFSVTQLTFVLTSPSTPSVFPPKIMTTLLGLLWFYFFFHNYDMQNHGNNNKKGFSSCFLLEQAPYMTMGRVLLKNPAVGNHFLGAVRHGASSSLFPFHFPFHFFYFPSLLNNR